MIESENHHFVTTKKRKKFIMDDETIKGTLKWMGQDNTIKTN